MNPIEFMQSGELVWFEDRGVGYLHPQKHFVYGEDYHQKYEIYRNNKITPRLMEIRVDLVNKFTADDVVDIGCGSGAFITARKDTQQAGRTTGYDVNPYVVHDLVEDSCFTDPWEEGPIKNACFWDSLEHIHDPAEIMTRIAGWVFISIPIFIGPTHARSSKHYRPDEHIWYFTAEGLIAMMLEQGFALTLQGQYEQEVGRQGIESFVFNRIMGSAIGEVNTSPYVGEVK